MITIRRTLARLRSQDDGISMAELLVYCLLLGGVMALVGSLLINSLRTQSTVTSVVDATTAGQLAAQSLGQGIRNSAEFQLTTVGTSDQLLQARVADNNGDWKCRAWYYSNSTNTLRYRNSADKILATEWTTDLAHWTLLADNVEPAAGLAAAAPIFTAAGSTVTFNFRVTAGDDPPATISSSAVRRITQGSTQCF